jgi:dipeptidyl aminopeptidase/acylaminoacyl peptidase
MAGKRVKVEDLWKLERPAQPTLSPDGAQACVSVTAYDMKENRGRASLWLLSAFGGEPRQLTTMGEKDGEPRWSPDGRWIAFVAKRTGAGKDESDDEPQVYVIAPDGGEARRLTDIATGAFGIKWFPDSRRIAFISWVWPETRGLDKLAKRWQALRDDKVKAHVVEHSSYRFWDHWITDGRVPHVFTVDLATGRIRDPFAGSPYELQRADTSAHYYDISPDGGEIAFGFDPGEDKRFDRELEMVALDVRRGKFRPLTRGSRLSHEFPRYSPDGKTLALLTQDLKRTPRAPNKLSFIDRKSGRLSVPASRWDGGIHGPLAWTPDSSSVLFTAEDHARLHLFRWKKGAAAPVVAARGGTIGDFDAAAGAIAFVRNDMSTPPAVFWSSGEEERRLDRLNAGVMGRVRLGEVREFHIDGYGGEKVQMWAV